MKKVLVIHNKYQNIGGEDTSVENEIKILKNFFEVEVLYFNNKLENVLIQFFNFLFNKNFKSLRKIKKKISSFNPDIVYIHNTWYKASLSLFDYLKKYDLKVIIKIHNFRYDCTRHFFTVNHLLGKNFCEKCGQSKSSLGILNKYFSDSFLKSFFIKIYGKKYYKILKNYGYYLFVLTEFHKNHLLNLGFDDKKIELVPNIIEIDSTKQNDINEDYIVYAGRISDEKGVKELIETYLKSNSKISKLKIIGKGPLLHELIQEYKSSKIEFLGEVKNNETLNIIKKSKGVVTATKLLEGQPTLLCEASSYGIVSVFPKTGGIEEFFPLDYDYSFQQGNYEDLMLKIEMLNNYTDVIRQGNLNKKFLEDFLKKNNIVKELEKIISES